MNPIVKCTNCIHYSNVSRNMIGMRWISCKKEIPYTKMTAAGCSFFEPTLRASNTHFLKELYDAFISFNGITFDKQTSNYWRLVDDNTTTYKRFSGRLNMYLRFNTEDELEKFYQAHINIIRNADLQIEYLK